jgi:ferritin-like metal-binding protein YciE
MKEANFAELYHDGIAEIYDAESQIVTILPAMIQASSSEELKAALEQHLKVTEKQLERLDRIFKRLGERPTRSMCHGMVGLAKENDKLLAEYEKSPVRDAALIAAAQKVEHYEISAYGPVRTLAERLGRQNEADLLQKTLNEEEEADEILTEIAERIMTGEEGEVTDEEEVEEEV